MISRYNDTIEISGEAMNGTPAGFGAIVIYNWDADSQFYYDDILIQK